MEKRKKETKKAAPLEAFSAAKTELLLKYLLFAALGALLSSAELLFGVRPFGLALLAVATTPALPVALGMAVYGFFTKDGVLLLGLGALLVIRVALAFFTPHDKEGIRLFEERPLYRFAAAGIVAFGIGLYTLLSGGFRFYDLFAMLLSVMVAPLAAWLYEGFFEKEQRAAGFRREAAVAALVLSGIFALRSVAFFSIYPAAAIAAALSFLLASHRGTVFGAVGGLLAGLCFDYRLAPAFFLCGLVFSLMEKSSRGGGVIAGSAAAGAYAFLLLQTQGLVSLLPSLLVAGACFLAFDSAGLVEGAPIRQLMMARRRAAARSAGAEAGRTSAKRLQEMSGALLDLSGTFYEISSRMRRPGLSALRHACDKAFDGVCPGCRHREICFGTEYAATAEVMEEMSRRLYKTGSVGKGSIKGALAARCPELPRILAAVNNGAAALAEESLTGDKTSVVAMDYAAIGRVIGETVSAANEEFSTDIAMSEKLFDRLQRMGYQPESVAVCGKGRRRVILGGVRAVGRSVRLRELRGAIEKYCHFTPGEPEVREHEGLYDMIFPQEVKIATASVKLTRPKGKGTGKHCGDSVAAFEGEAGTDYTFICDGMGSGNTAALTSALASVFLTRLLSAGSRAESALKMLNGFLSARRRGEGENSTTVDLLEVDLVAGEARLYKCGAAPSYLLRRGELTRFFSRTAPIGILETLDAERIAFPLEVGDVILQVSDGITGGEEDCPWLEEMLQTRYDGDAESFARMVLNRATGECPDDLSLIITEIKSAATPVGERQTA